MLKNLSKLKIEKRLSKSFTLVSLITSIAAVIGLIALIITTTQYSNALKIMGSHRVILERHLLLLPIPERLQEVLLLISRRTLLTVPKPFMILRNRSSLIT